VSTEKFARYFDVEARLVPVEDGQWVMHPDRALEMVDENTIGAPCDKLPCAVLAVPCTRMIIVSASSRDAYT